MKISINNDLSTSQIQEQFSEAFPGLKIVFVKHSHGEGEGTKKEDIIHVDKTVKELSGDGLDVQIEINKSETVGEIEGKFRDHLGLNIQVFRKAGGVWIETVNTDHWTIAQQLEAVR